MTIKLALFDFDGTLADSFPWFLNAFDQVADRYGFKRLDRSEIDVLRGLNARQLVAHYGIPTWKIPLIARHFRMLMRRDIAWDQIVAGMLPFLITRQIFGGAGKMGIEAESAQGEPGVYQLYGGKERPGILTVG